MAKASARTVTHYRMTMKRPVAVRGTNFNPGARYTVKAAIHDEIKAIAADAIATADPQSVE